MSNTQQNQQNADHMFMGLLRAAASVLAIRSSSSDEDVAEIVAQRPVVDAMIKDWFDKHPVNTWFDKHPVNTEEMSSTQQNQNQQNYGKVLEQLKTEFDQVWDYADVHWGKKYVALAQHQFLFFAEEVASRTDAGQLLKFCQCSELDKGREDGLLDEYGGATCVAPVAQELKGENDELKKENEELQQCFAQDWVVFKGQNDELKGENEELKGEIEELKEAKEQTYDQGYEVGYEVGWEVGREELKGENEELKGEIEAGKNKRKLRSDTTIAELERENKKLKEGKDQVFHSGRSHGRSDTLVEIYRLVFGEDRAERLPDSETVIHDLLLALEIRADAYRDDSPR